MTTTTKTYSVVLTSEELQALSNMITMAEFWKVKQGAGTLDGAEVDAMFKVSDQMQRYYDDNGIDD